MLLDDNCRKKNPMLESRLVQTAFTDGIATADLHETRGRPNLSAVKNPIPGREETPSSPWPHLACTLVCDKCPTPQVSYSVLVKATARPGTLEHWSSLAATRTTCTSLCNPRPSVRLRESYITGTAQGSRRTAMARNLSLSPGMLL